MTRGRGVYGPRWFGAEVSCYLYSSSGKVTWLVSVLPFSAKVSAMDGKTCIPKRKFFPLRVDPMLVGLRPLWETRTSKKNHSLCKMVGRMGVYPHTKIDCQLFDKYVICSRIISILIGPISHRSEYTD